MATTLYCAHCMHSFQHAAPECPNLACRTTRPDDGWPVVYGPGDLFDRHFQVDRLLAVGGAGLTYLACAIDERGERTGDPVAIKVLRAQRDAGPYLQRLATEAQVLQRIRHPHIVEAVGFVQRAGGSPYLVTRFERGGTLHDLIVAHGPLQPAVAARLGVQILSALQAAHSNGVIHRDLKPQNLLLRTPFMTGGPPHAVIVDFGIAKLAGPLAEGLTQVGTFVGTPEYAAPEQFLGQAPTAATDLYAVGGVLAFLVTGTPPVALKHRGDAGACVRQLRGELPPSVTTDPRLNEAIAGLMAYRPADRWPLARAAAALAPLVDSEAPAAPTPLEPASPADTLVPSALGLPLPQGTTSSGRIRVRDSEPTGPAVPVDHALGADFWGVDPAEPAQKLDIRLDTWVPIDPAPPPLPLPRRTRALLRTLGTCAVSDRAPVLDALARAGDLATGVAAARDGAEARGAALAAGAGLVRPPPTLVRTWLAASDVDLRACACVAAGACATGAVLPALARGVTDREPMVRRLTAFAVGAAAERLGRPELVHTWLRPLRSDRDPDVREAWTRVTADVRDRQAR